MPNTYTQILYHVVFSTKNRAPVLTADRRDELYRYMWGIHKNLRCHLFRIGGTEDHVHIFNSIHPFVAVADFVKTIKTASNGWITDGRIFPEFAGWQGGYGAFTLSIRDKDSLIEYIKGQQEHHRKETFLDEYRRLLAEHGIEFDERYLA